MQKNKKLVWCTDVHLNFVNEAQIVTFANKILKQKPDSVVMTGDISEAPVIENHLRFLDKCLSGFVPSNKRNIPVYFVCGNHDYYHGSIKDTRKLIKSHFTPPSNTLYLPPMGVVELASEVALVGHDGWYDGGYPDHGNWLTSRLEMNDYYVIKELAPGQCINRKQRYQKLRSLAKEGADHFRTYLPEAFKHYNKVFLATHVAPFPENSLAPDGTMSDRDWHPSFCSKQSGDAILDVMKKMPAEKELIVLCGHNHTRAVYKPLANVTCITGQAKYGRPDIADVFIY